LKTLIVPNGKIVDDTITNYSERGAIRLELNVTMPYEESFPRVKEVIINTLKTIPVVLQDPAPQVGIENFDSHNIVLTVRPFVLPDDYWEGTFESLRLIKKAFNDNQIKVAYSEGIEIGPIGE
jgi:small conductance mechanosensitive channel